MEFQNLEQLIQGLPQEFEFYHLGSVKMGLVDFPPLDTVSGISFKLDGDIHALMVLLFPKELDLSTYSELGNILVSRVVSELNKKNKTDLIISPPRLLQENQLRSLLQTVPIQMRKHYLHLNDSIEIPIETLFLSTSTGGAGYA